MDVALAQRLKCLLPPRLTGGASSQSRSHALEWNPPWLPNHGWTVSAGQKRPTSAPADTSPPEELTNVDHPDHYGGDTPYEVIKVLCDGCPKNNSKSFSLVML